MCKNKILQGSYIKKSGLYEFKMALFGKVQPEEFLLFVRNFQMTFQASGAISSSENIQYLCMLLCGESLCLFDTFLVEVVSMTTTYLNPIIFGLGTYFFPNNWLTRRNCTMRRGIRKLCELRVKGYAVRMIKIN